MSAEHKRLATMLLSHYAKDKQITVTNEVSDFLIRSIRNTVDLEREIRKAMAQHVADALLGKSRIQFSDTATSFSKKFRADAWIFTPDEIADLAVGCYEAGLRSKEVNL